MNILRITSCSYERFNVLTQLKTKQESLTKRLDATTLQETLGCRKRRTTQQHTKQSLLIHKTMNVDL